MSGEKETTIEPRAFRLLMPKVFRSFKPSDVLRRDYAANDRAALQSANDTIAKVQAQLQKEGAKASVGERDALLGMIAFVIPKDAANVKAAERAFVTALGAQWKGALEGGDVTIGEVRVELH